MGISLITIFVRHSAGCKYAGDEFARRCNCPKHLRWTSERKQHRRTAGTRSWAVAEEKKRELEDQLAGRTPQPQEGGHDIRGCISVFLQDKRVQGISEDALAKYARELDRMRTYCEAHGTFTIQGVTRELLTGYCSTWDTVYPSSQTRAIVRARCRSFFRYCYEAEWITRIPALPKITVDEMPTLPLSEREYETLLEAVDLTFPDEYRRKRTRALFQLMRWTGLALGDALKLRPDELEDMGTFYRVVTSRQKTGTDVSVAIRPDIAREILAVPNGDYEHAANGVRRTGSARYIFWDGKSDIVQTWTKRIIAPVFKRSGITRGGNMTSHRLRDTFAVDLLQKGVPMEEVSRFLGHTSIRTTEKHYAKWGKGRQDRADELVLATWKPSAGSNPQSRLGKRHVDVESSESSNRRSTHRSRPAGR